MMNDGKRDLNRLFFSLNDLISKKILLHIRFLLFHCKNQLQILGNIIYLYKFVN